MASWLTTILLTTDGPNQKENIKLSEDFVAKHPQWKLSLQTHKILGIP